MATIRSGGTEVDVDDSLGGLIVSVRDPEGTDLLADGNPRDPELLEQRNLAATGFRGWIDCFPSIDAESDSTNGRDSLALAGHGEVWWQAWSIDELNDESIAVSLVHDGFGVRYGRRVSVHDRVVRVETTLASNSDRSLNFVWASHPLFAADDATWIDLPDAPTSTWPHDASFAERLDELWPSETTRREWTDLPYGAARKVFMSWPSEGVRFTRDGRVRHIRFSATAGQPAPYLGLWLNRGGFPAGAPLEHFAIEPAFGNADSLAAAVERGTAGVLAPRSTASFVVELTI